MRFGAPGGTWRKSVESWLTFGPVSQMGHREPGWAWRRCGSCSEKKRSVTFTMNMPFGERPSGNQTPYLNPACLCQAPHRMNTFNENICIEIRIITHIKIANFCNVMLNKLRSLYSLYWAPEAFRPPEAPDRSTASFIHRMTAVKKTRTSPWESLIVNRKGTFGRRNVRELSIQPAWVGEF